MVLARATGLLARRPSTLTGPAERGVAIAGELTRASGIGETARLMATAATRLGLPVWAIDLPPLVDDRPEVEVGSTAPPPAGVPLVMHVNAPMLPLALLRLPPAMTRNRRIIGYWAWEVPEVPPEWRPALACVSEIWVPSCFTAAMMEPLLPGQVRVVPPPLGIVPPIASRLDRAAFGLPEAAVVVLVSFNLASSFTRKNPFGAVAAFRGAFGDRADRILVLKVSHPDHAPADFARLAQMAQAPNIRLDTRTLPPCDNHAPDSLRRHRPVVAPWRGLWACAGRSHAAGQGRHCHRLVRQHRLHGCPKCRVGWGYRLAPARDDRSVYRGLWAEPDVAEAAALLRQFADDPVLRRDVGELARTSTLNRLDGQQLKAALGDLA